MPVNCLEDYKSGYPAFIKPKDGSSSINAFKVADKEELKVYASQIKDYVIQPFIEGTEYTIDIFCDLGRKSDYHCSASQSSCSCRRSVEDRNKHGY